MKRRIIQALLCAAVSCYLFCNNSISTTASESACYLDDNLIDICFDAQEKYNISACLIASIIQAESSGNKDAVNGSCKGLMQVSEIHGYDNLHDPRSNIYAGCEVLQKCIDKADGELYLALMYYNGVKDAKAKYNKWLEAGDYSTYPTEYVEKCVHGSLAIEGEWYGSY